jgi:selenocysteine lyase/cysteine desulfurase
VVNALNTFIQGRHNSDDTEYYKPCQAILEETRKNLARLVHTGPERIGIVKNTGEGLNILASGLEWNAGDRILLTDYEFPSNVYPFLNLQRHGVEIDYVKNQNGKILLEDIERMLTPKTKLLSISFVEFINGYRNDLKTIGKLCHSNNTVFCVDSIQGVGAFDLPVEETGIDFLSNGGQKWLMGPMGTAFIYLTKEIQDRIQPAYAGWLSVENAWDFFDFDLKFLSSAQRYEHSTHNFLGLAGLNAAVKLLLEVGIPNIEMHLQNLGEQLISGLRKHNLGVLSDDHPQFRSGIISFTHPDPIRNEAIYRELKQKKIYISLRPFLNGDKILRAAPHFYNTEEEIDKLLLAIKTGS